MTRQRKGDWPLFPPEDTNSENFNYLEYLKLFPAEAIQYGSARRSLTRYNPLLFALIYFRHHLMDETTGEITFSDFHLASCNTALNWAKPITEPKQYRDCVVAPRATGKSTWWFLILPMWAAAHGHTKFLAAYSDTATQAESHLSNFKRELETNELLRQDYRELHEPSRKKSTGRPIADNSAMLQTASGFTFVAKGIDSGTLGLKVGALRPDLLILDDIEPGEANYSIAQAKKRLSTVQDVIFPLSLTARVAISGTVTMNGSIIHDLVKSAQGQEVAQWIIDEGIKVHYFPPIITDDNGHQRSLWSAKWGLSFLKSIQHTRSYAKNFANSPVAADGDYWTEDSFKFTDNHDGSVVTYMSIDPSVTGKKTSDYTAIAVVSYIPPSSSNPVINAINPEGLKGIAVVRHSSHVRMSPGPELRQYILSVLAEFPETRKILIETNQGGDTWKSIFHSMPIELETVHQTIPKDVRAAQLLTDYEMGRVLHEGQFPDLQEEQMAFPNGHNDDQIDAVGTAVIRIRAQEALRMKKPIRPPKQRDGSYA